MNSNVTTAEGTILKRMRALFESLMDESELIPKSFKPVARNLVEGYLRKADPETVRAIVIRIRDEIIPWILHEEERDPNL
jgi:hypothetical protein